MFNENGRFVCDNLTVYFRFGWRKYSIFVSASHQTGLNTKSMTQRSIIVGLGEGEVRHDYFTTLVIDQLRAMWA